MTATGTVRFGVMCAATDQAAHAPGAGAAPFTQVATAVVRGQALGLSTVAKLLYVVLRSYAAPDGTCYPGYATLRADVGCGLNQLTQAMRELEAAGLVTRRRRGQGKPTLYTLHMPSAPPAPQTPRWRESRVAAGGNQDSPQRGAEQDSEDQDPAEQQQPAPAKRVSTAIGAGDDDPLAALVSHGMTLRVAQRLVTAHGAEAIREQLAWHPHRPPARNPAGALVRAIQERWPAPPGVMAAHARAAAAARQAAEARQREVEDEARRREWAAKPPEERIAGRLTFWIQGRRAKRHEPTAAEIAARRTELLAELAAAGGVS